MSYLKYIVAQGDTLEIISLSALGIEDVDSIAKLNNLRYPFISDDPKDQLAHPKGQIALTQSVSSSSNSITVNNTDSITIRPFDSVYIEDWTSNLNESAVVKSVTTNSGGTLSITFQSNLVNAYSTDSILTVFVNQQNVQSRVLKTGDTLYLPVNQTQTTLQINNYDDFYGTDIQLDQNGLIQKSNNDWSTVSDVNNVLQAFDMRVKTPYGAHPFHPNYGNRMFELSGETSEPYYWNLSKTFIRQCALYDNRIEDVQNISISTSQDQIFIESDVFPSNSHDSFTTNTVLQGGDL